MTSDEDHEARLLLFSKVAMVKCWFHGKARCPSHQEISVLLVWRLTHAAHTVYPTTDERLEKVSGSDHC